MLLCTHIKKQPSLSALRTGFSKERLEAISLARDSGSLSNLFLWDVRISLLSPPSWERSLRIVCLFQSCWALLSTESHPPLFPRTVHLDARTLVTTSTPLSPSWRNLMVTHLILVLQVWSNCSELHSLWDPCLLLRTALSSEIYAGCWDLPCLLSSLLGAGLGSVCCTSCQEPPMPFFVLSCSRALQLCQIPQHFGWSKTGEDFSGSIPNGCVCWMHFSFFLFPAGDIIGCFLMFHSANLEERKTQVKVNCSFFTCFNVVVLKSHVFLRYCNFLTWFWVSHKNILVHIWLLNHCFSVCLFFGGAGGMCQDALFCHLAEINPFLQNLRYIFVRIPLPLVPEILLFT